MISGRFYTSEELQKILGVTKQRITDLARNQGWVAHRVGVLYDADDVTAYLWSRYRRDLARQMGVTVPGLVNHEDWDRDDGCPVCGAFAVWKPATLNEVTNPEIEIFDDKWPWRCIKGHGPEGK